MYQSQDYILNPLMERIKQEGFTKLPQIENSEFATNIETKQAFRVKILKSVGIAIPDAKIKDGINITTEAWFNGETVVCINHAMQERYFMEGDKGPEVKSMGSVLWISHENKLFDNTIGKIIPFLKKVNYVGPISIIVTATKDKLYATDITAGFSYNGIFILLEMYKGKVGSLITKLANKTLDKLEFKSQIGIGVDLSVLPFPLMINDSRFSGTPIEGLNKFNLKHFWGYDIYESKGKFYTSGTGGRIGTVTARGDDIAGFSPLRDARRRVYRTISNIQVLGLMYRLDIGARVESDKTKLANWGWL